MSQSVILVRFPSRYRQMADLPQGVETLPLGSPREVREKLNAAFPGLTWFDDVYGRWEEGGTSLEFSVDENPVKGVHITLRGDGSGLEWKLTALGWDDGWHAIHEAGVFIDEEGEEGNG